MVNVLHVINNLAPEGAPTLLMSFVKNLDDRRYRQCVAFIYGTAELVKNGDWNSTEIFDLTRNGKFDFFSLYRLVRIIKTRKIDLVHTHLVHAGIIGKLAARLAGVRHVVTTRHYGFHPKENTFWYRLEDRMTGSACAVIAISDAVKQRLIQRNVVAEEKIELIYNGIDFKTFDSERINRETPQANGDFIIGSIGRLHPQKGFATLLQSFKLVSNKFQNVRLEIVGDGALREQLQNQAHELNISDRVRFFGAAPHGIAIERLTQWDVFVLASLWEGFGIAMIEAMALEKAVVATNQGGTVEIVDDGVTGFLVPPESPTAIASNIIDLLSDETRRIEMGRAAKRKVSEEFSIEKFVERTKRLYDSILGV